MFERKLLEDYPRHMLPADSPQGSDGWESTAGVASAARVTGTAVAAEFCPTDGGGNDGF